jgi:hypothetical protein
MWNGSKPRGPVDEVAQSQRHRRGIVVEVKRQPTKRRQPRHLRNPYSEYAAPPELGNSRLAAATTMPRLWRSQQLPPTLPAQNTPAHQRAEQPAQTPKPRQTRPSGGSDLVCRSAEHRSAGFCDFNHSRSNAPRSAHANYGTTPAATPSGLAFNPFSVRAPAARSNKQPPPR